MSRPSLTKRRPVCVNCGAKYGQRHTHDVTLRWAEGEPEPRYEGNLIVVKRWGVRKFTRATSLPVRGDVSIEFKEEPNSRRIEVWDGQTWFGGYDPFCTLRCALSYARRAYAKGGAR